MSYRNEYIDWREWPTFILILFCYLSWLAITYYHSELGLPLSLILGAITITFHSSLNHEVLHGHPTKSDLVNEILVFPALSLFFPYRRFKALHIAHHNDDILTDPFDDSETYYVAEADWRRYSPFTRSVLTFMNSLFGRLLLGPGHMVVFLLRRDIPLILEGNREVRLAWALQVCSVALVFLWVAGVAGMSIWQYLAMAYLGASLLMVRTFAEHRAHANGGGRTVIVETGRFFGVLFLYNNLHIVHHRDPKVAWYRLPALYRANRQSYLAENDGYLFSGYGEVFRRYLWQPKEPVMHPLNRRLAPD